MALDCILLEFPNLGLGLLLLLLIVQMLILSDPQASALTDQSQSWIWSNCIVLSLTMEQIIKCFHSGFILP